MLQILTIEKNMFNSIWMMNPIQGSLLSTFIWHIVWNISLFCRYHNGSIRTSMHDSIWSIFFIILYVTYSTNYKMLSIKTAMFSIDLRCVHAWSQFNAIYLVWILIKSLLQRKSLINNSLNRVCMLWITSIKYTIFFIFHVWNILQILNRQALIDAISIENTWISCMHPHRRLFIL